MIIQHLFGNGYAILWLMYIIGLFLYARSDVGLMASGRNGVQMETMLGKTYAIFLIQVSVALTIVVFPIAQLLLKQHWLDVISGTFITTSLGLVAMITIKQLTVKVDTVMKKRAKDERYNHEGCRVYRHYKTFTWFWLVFGVVFLGFIQFSRGRLDFSILSDFIIWFAMIVYMIAIMTSSMGVVEALEKEEDRNREQVSGIVKDKKKERQKQKSKKEKQGNK